MAEFTIQCCVCKTIVKQGDPEAPISHTYCPPCKEQVLADIEAWKEEANVCDAKQVPV